MSGIQWERRPPTGEGLRNYTLRRCPPRGRLNVTITSHDMVCCAIHFAGNRTRPCTGEICESCNRGQAPRWKGYFCAIDHATGDKLMVEVTANVAQRISAYFDTHRTLIGAQLFLARKGKADNATVISRIEEPAATTGTLPAGVDVRPMLERMWEVAGRQTPQKILVEKPRLAPTGTDGSLGNEQTD